MLFLSVSGGAGDRNYSKLPEAYPRAKGTFYAYHPANDSIKLPSSTDKVEADGISCKDIRRTIFRISPELDKGKVLVEQACFQPLIKFEGHRKKNAGPQLGPSTHVKVFVASGHNSWGVQNAPGTGRF